MTIDPSHRQLPFSVRFDWGVDGAEAITSGAATAVVVDVLSFTTTLSVALDLGTTVVPWRTHDDDAAVYAREHGAALAVRRSVARPGEISLSPATLRAGPAPSLLVLPSPNGSTISARLRSADVVCLGGSLRNAPAVARWIASHRLEEGPIAIVAAGERWPNGALRPSVEDLWGGGYIASELASLAPDLALSPEARVAADAWESIRDRAPDALAASASGSELIAGGYEIDVDVAAEIGVSTVVPIMRSGRYTNAETG